MSLAGKPPPHSDYDPYYEVGWKVTSGKVDGLMPKAKILSYCEHDYDDLLEMLKKNKEKLGINPSTERHLKLLKDEFEKSVGKLWLPREKIERTVRLIDLVVYEL